MKLTDFYLPTLRETPSECDTISSQLMFRAGLIRKLTSGIYEYLPLGLRVIKKIEQITREEMDAIGGLEVWLPHLLPRNIWDETGRWQLYGNELFRLKDRKNADFCLSPTAEEVITDLIRGELRSYRQLPKMFYQFGVKFRDEIRPRFGVIRAREFYMKDAYSFHKDEKDAEEYYKKVFDAYCRIFRRCGLKFVVVEAATGAIGGKFSHEFMVVKENDPNFIGEETIVFCSECGYSANIEKAECIDSQIDSYEFSDLKNLQEVYTPNVRTVEEVSNFLKESKEKFIKTLVYISEISNNVYLVLIKGDYEVNESKLKDIIGDGTIRLASAELVKEIFGVSVGFLGPVNLQVKKDYIVKIIADNSIKYIINGISGANKEDYHVKNINYGRDYNVDKFGDIRNITKYDLCPICKKKNTLNFSKGIEIGHTFKLGTKYSEAMNATFLDENNKERYFVMGCYGIGISRIVAAAIEQNYDEKGIIWHPNIAPFLVYILPIDYNDYQIKEVADKLYNLLLKHNIEVILDDRDERPGVKFKDADLIGIPLRITVSKRLLPDQVELYIRKTSERQVININEIINKINETLASLKNF
ncbi:MAG: proline--tRNA ligase [Elusimicrobiota bacterium]|nr:proline--tRNA ligase [Endomicrobiia bacterium]MDW8165177.1 proline--tRNA ligase [Elusimicrobiota bacterium]